MSEDFLPSVWSMLLLVEADLDRGLALEDVDEHLELCWSA